MSYEALALKIANFADLSPVHQQVVAVMDEQRGGITSGYSGLTDEHGARHFLFAYDLDPRQTVVEVAFPADLTKDVIVLGLHSETGWHLEATIKTLAE